MTENDSIIREAGKILDHVHDRAFDISRLVFDQSRRLVTIPIITLSSSSTRELWHISFLSVIEIPLQEASLIIENVEAIEIDDKDELGWVMVRDFVVSAGVVRVRGCTSASLILNGDEICISLYISKNIVGYKKFLSLWRR